MSSGLRGQHIVAVAGLVVRGSRVLALRRAATNLAGPGLWETVSGRIEQGEDCAAPGRSCCDGSRCARFGDDAFRCLPTCASDEGCGGNCCTPLEGGDDVCAPSPC